MAIYPRKQTLAIFLICAVVTGGVAFYVHDQNKAISQENYAGEKVSTATAVNSAPTKLPETNWQKDFLGSNATNTSLKSSATVKTNTPEKLTNSDKLGRQFLTAYGELKQSGLSSDPDAITNAMNDVIANAANIQLTPKVYNLGNINLVANTASAITNYGAVIKSVSNEYDEHTDEAQIAAEAFETENTASLAKIDPIIKQYKTMIAKLLAVPVPQQFSQSHINLVNGLSSALFSTEAFRHMDTDPIQGLAAVRLSGEGASQIVTAFYLIQNGLAANLSLQNS